VPLNAQKENCFPVREGRVENDTYEQLIDCFIKDINALNGFGKTQKLFGDSFLEALVHLYYKYFWSVPAQTPRAGYEPDVSIFDHSRMTSALAISFFDDISRGVWTERDLEISTSRIRACKFEPPEGDEYLSEELFLFVGGDLSGIKDFVYNIPTKGAAKSLKGRSLYLELLTETIAKRILREFDLPSTNLIYSGGGNFYCLVPIAYKEELLKLRKEIAQILFNVHNGSIYCAISWIPLAIRDFFSGRIADKWAGIGEKSGKLKRRKFSEMGLEENFERIFGPLEPAVENADICPVCRQSKRLKEIEEGIKICSFCDSFKGLAENLKKANYYCEKFSANAPQKPLDANNYKDVFKSLGVDIDFSASPKSGFLNYRLNSPQGWKANPQIVGFKFLPQGIPLENGAIRMFDEIAKESSGLKALGLLQMDVDNLGRIFREGLPKKQRTLSRIATLSRLLSLFFSGYINLLWENGYSDTVYIIFAGGDDSLIYGAWDKLYQFMKSMRADFASFVSNNPRVTLSGSFSICPPKFPVVKAISISEDGVDAAKARVVKTKNLEIPEKNNLSILGIPLRYDSEFNEMENWRVELLGIRDKKGKEDALRLVRKVNRATIGFKAILQDSLRGRIRLARIWRFAYFLRRERKDENLQEFIERLVSRNEKIVLDNVFQKRIVEEHMILPLAARLVDFELREP
jgi:CRISPR-associated protein Csm1